MNSTYGTGPSYDNAAASKGVWLQLPRRRMNFVPMVISVLAPWGLFVLVFSIMAFSFHYQQPTLSLILALVLLLVVVVVGVKAAAGRLKIFGTVPTEREPSWLIFFALSLLLAWVMGFLQGSAVFSANTGRFYEVGNLNNYTNVFPNRMLGQQLLDAGIVSFAPGSMLDTKKSMGFKNQNMYCVAPIVFGTTPPTSYDFWAIGNECCSGNQPDFHCENFNNPQASGGIRLMNAGDRSFYRLAVQQAEATYNIKANHPLFFRWEVDPSKTVEGWMTAGRSSFVAWIMSYLVFQLFMVAIMSVIFSKIGHY